MKRSIILALPTLVAIAAAAACGNGGGTGGGGSGGSTTSGTTSSSTGTTSTGTSTHMNQCVQTTDKGNANGVGAYCTPGGDECQQYPMAAICLADIGQDEWFCTRIGCSMDSDCGTEATCVMQTGGSACVPNKCLQGYDAGTD